MKTKKDIIKLEINFLQGQLVDVYIKQAWSETPSYTGFTGSTANTDNTKNTYDMATDDYIKLIKQRIKELELELDFIE